MALGREEAASFPERVGRYELLLPIGTGGMASVYLARVPVVEGVHREFALKLMHPFMRAEEKDAAAAMIEEAKLAVRIRHPNVVPVIEIGDGPQGIYLVMDYVEGDTLSGLGRSAKKIGKPIPSGIVARIVLDALAGLHAAHELKGDDGHSLQLVHRDFSPQNILVGTDGVSRLTDFGVAKAAGRVNVTTSGVIKGKVSYMSPEQALGKVLDRRSDVWAAGVVIWELLSGQRLYKQDDQVATLLKIVREPPPRLRSVNPSIPESIDQIVADALSMDVEQRIPTAAELRRRLTEAWRQEGPLADTTEVADYVQQVTAEKLATRREQVAHVLKLRARLARVGENAARAAEEVSSPSASFGPLAGDRDSGISASSRSEIAVEQLALEDSTVLAPVRGSRARRFAVAGVVGGLGALGLAGALLLTNRAEPAGPIAPAAVAASAAAPTAEAAPSAPPSAAPQPVEKPTLKLRANAPIQSLRVDSAAVPLAEPSTEVSVPLAAEAQRRALRVEARATDGRKATTTIAAGEHEGELKFAAPTKAPAPLPPAASGTPKKPPDLPGLAPTPY